MFKLRFFIFSKSKVLFSSFQKISNCFRTVNTIHTVITVSYANQVIREMHWLVVLMHAQNVHVHYWIIASVIPVWWWVMDEDTCVIHANLDIQVCTVKTVKLAIMVIQM